MEVGRSGARRLLATFVLVVPVLGHAAETTTYTYDELGRLTKTAVAGGPAAASQISSAFDAADNRTNQSVSGPVTGSPAFVVNSSSAPEGSALTFTVLLLGAPATSVTVNYSTSNGTATAPGDYTAASNVLLSFPAGTSSKTFTVPTVADGLSETNQTFNVTLSNASAGSVIAAGGGTGVGTIVEGAAPPPPSFAIGNAAAVTEGQSLTFAVTKTGSTSGSYTVAYATASGTATSGSDFTSATGTLTFVAAATTQTITVPTIDDSIVESSETMLVNLSSPSGGATITDTQGSGTINDNDTVTNQPPIANPDNAGTMPVCSNMTVNVLANDTDPDGNLPLSLVSASGGAGISVSVSSTTTINLQSFASSGTKSFSYVVQDALGATANGTGTVSVQPGTCE